MEIFKNILRPVFLFYLFITQIIFQQFKEIHIYQLSIASDKVNFIYFLNHYLLFMDNLPAYLPVYQL